MRTTTRCSLIFFCVLILALPVSGGQKSKKRHGSPPVRQVQPVPGNPAANYGKYNFSFRTAEGKLRHLSEFAGKVVLVNLWTTPCAPCTLEAEGFSGIYDKYHRKGFEILSIAVTASEGDVRSFITTTDASWPVGMGVDIVGVFNAYALPDNYLFLPDGTLAKHFVGYLKESVLQPVLIDALRRITPPPPKP
jgi:thiol-disulfide isomerase/thioredoxin